MFEQARQAISGNDKKFHDIVATQKDVAISNRYALLFASVALMVGIVVSSFPMELTDVLKGH
jgi:hypothetical protein